jgi:hypothetical protein
MDDEIELVSGGYLAVCPSPLRTAWMNRPVPPISVSGCMVETAPFVTWIGSWAEDATAFGISADHFGTVRAWLEGREAQGDLLRWNLATNPGVVKEFLKFAQLAETAAVLGLALPAIDAPRFISAYDENLGQNDGLVAMVRKGLPPADGGTLLGYEILCANYGGISCSWWCNHLPGALLDGLGITLNEFGLLGSWADAAAAHQAVRDCPAKEEGLWNAWAIMRYD